MTAPYVKSVLEDQSTRVVSNNGVYTGIAIEAKKGEVGVPKLITNQTELLRVFTPNERIESGWDMAYYSAYYYLKEGSRLWVVRACSDDAMYSGLLLKVRDKGANVAIAGTTTPSSYALNNNDACLIYASSQGKWGNDVGIKIVTDQSKVKLDGAFIIEVYKNLRTENGARIGDLVESHLVSFDVSLKTGYGTNCFIETVLKGSNYIRAIVNDVAIDTNDNLLPAPQDTILAMDGGTDGSPIGVNDRITAIKKLKNPNEFPLSMLMDGGETSPAYQNALLGICAERTDCIAILSVNYEATQTGDNKLDNMIAHRNNLSGSLPYLGSLYAPHQLMYDEFNDRNIYIDPATFVAGRSADVIENYGWHWSNAGYNRGIVNTLDVATSFTHEELDRLSDYEINCIIKEPGEGNLIYDQLTLQSKASDLQELPISRYINCYLRPALKDMLKYYLFEFNDAQTRADIEEKITNFMRVEQANRACYGFQVKCNEENNTASDIENNRLNVWLYIKPTKFAKFIEQKIVITPYSTSLANVSL